jgi:superfamily II DNA/RNA helicase
LHGNLTQPMREAALEAFRDGKANFLMCTDLASRYGSLLTVVAYTF